MKLTLPTNSAERKEYPMFRGLLAYFSAALAGVARHSFINNEKHNPGEPMHHARGKSNDHPDCVLRHTTDIGDMLACAERIGNYDEGAELILAAKLLAEADALAWRALAWSQELHERFGGAPLAPAARLQENGEPERLFVPIDEVDVPLDGRIGSAERFDSTILPDMQGYHQAGRQSPLARQGYPSPRCAVCQTQHERYEFCPPPIS